MSIKTKVSAFLTRATKKLKKLADEEDRLKNQARKVSDMEDKLAREERLAYIRAEQYKLKVQMEKAKTAYLKAKARRQGAEAQTDTLLDRANKTMTRVFGTRTTNKGRRGKSLEEKITGYKPTSRKKKDPWNFWD